MTLKTTIAVPSLKSDSPSIRVANLLLTPSSLSRATTATGSVALRIDPKSTASENVKLVNCKGYNITNAVINVPIRTPGTAKSRICPISLLNMCQSALKLLSKISGGKNKSIME